MIVSIELQERVSHFIGCSHCLNVFDGFPFNDLGTEAAMAGWTVIDNFVVCPNCLKERQENSGSPDKIPTNA